jgi:hypothetical protein
VTKALAIQAVQVAAPIQDGAAKPSLKELRKRLTIRKATLDAVEYAADHGVPLLDAAAKYGVNATALGKVMQRSDVAAYLEERANVRLALLRSKAVKKVGDLMDGRSEYVQLEAARTVLAETKRTESGVAGNVHIEIVL